MTRILSLFQIKSVRSAWVFLLGSGLMFVFGTYQAVTFPSYPSGDPRGNFETTFFLFWFLVAGTYIAIASWALFSVKGRAYLTAQEKIPLKGNRTVLWYPKFLFACCAAAFATIMLLGILLLPFTGYAGLEVMFGPESSLYFLIAGLFWSPLVFRYLK